MTSRVAVVTGASSGIGRAVMTRFLASDHAVAAFDMDTSKVAGTGQWRAYAADVTKADQVNAAIERAVGDFGRIDILVNCVGASLHERKIEDVSEKDWDATFDLNVRSAFLCTRGVVPSMKRGKWGRIINISAVAGRTFTLFGGADFTAAKAALIGFTRQLALELAPHGITANVVAPGLTLSERVAASWQGKAEADKEVILSRIPMGRPSTVDEQAAAICFLCGEDASYISGSVLDVNGAMYVA